MREPSVIIRGVDRVNERDIKKAVWSRNKDIFGVE